MRKSISPIVLLALAGTLAADVPRVGVPERYQRLWKDSPFTNDPIPPGPVGEKNPLEDYALGGISRLVDGYYAILINKKLPGAPKMIIRPGSDSDFEVLEVRWSETDWKDTVALIRHREHRGVVKFENDLTTLTSPAADPQPRAGRDELPVIAPRPRVASEPRIPESP